MFHRKNDHQIRLNENLFLLFDYLQVTRRPGILASREYYLLKQISLYTFSFSSTKLTLNISAPNFVTNIFLFPCWCFVEETLKFFMLLSFLFIYIYITYVCMCVCVYIQMTRKGWKRNAIEYISGITSIGIYHITRKSRRIKDFADPAASVNLLRFEKSISQDETQRQEFLFLFPPKKETSSLCSMLTS